MPRAARWLATLPVLGLLGACLPAFAPSIRPTEHHAGLGPSTPNARCMGCHESERQAQARLAVLEPHAREHAMRSMMDGGASLVAQWMIDDPRSCASCHEPRGAR